MELLLTIILLAFIFELMDSSAGMGFGTGLAPLLFFIGYDPLQVVPVLLISEMITGITAGWFHNEFENVRFSFRRPLTKATRIMILIAFFGCFAIFSSVMLSYFTIKFSKTVIKMYVAIMVIFMGLFGLARIKMDQMTDLDTSTYRPKLLVVFSAVAGFNKGIGGGGYGPVVTMGQIFSGIYEKSATAIVSLAEGIVSAVGVATFFMIEAVGVNVDLVLLPSVFTGGFFAAILSPYIVRVLPNKLWRFVIPTYALIIGGASLLKLSF